MVSLSPFLPRLLWTIDPDEIRQVHLDKTRRSESQKHKSKQRVIDLENQLHEAAAANTGMVIQIRNEQDKTAKHLGELKKI